MQLGVSLGVSNKTQVGEVWRSLARGASLLKNSRAPLTSLNRGQIGSNLSRPRMKTLIINIAKYRVTQRLRNDTCACGMHQNTQNTETILSMYCTPQSTPYLAITIHCTFTPYRGRGRKIGGTLSLAADASIFKRSSCC